MHWSIRRFLNDAIFAWGSLLIVIPVASLLYALLVVNQAPETLWIIFPFGVMTVLLLVLHRLWSTRSPIARNLQLDDVGELHGILDEKYSDDAVFFPTSQRAKLGFALAYHFGFIDDRGMYYYYQPAEELAEPIKLGLGKEHAIQTLASQTDLLDVVLQRVESHIETIGHEAVLGDLAVLSKETANAGDDLAQQIKTYVERLQLQQEDQLRERCRQIVNGVLTQRGWQLVQDEAAFVEEVLTEVQSRLPSSRQPLDRIIEDITIRRYNHILYDACRAEETSLQRQAFKELLRYLYPIALYLAESNQAVAEESVQGALLNIWRHLGQVHDPSSFVHWARYLVRLEVLARMPASNHEITEAETVYGGGDEAMRTREGRAELESVIRRCLPSEWQQKVVIGLILEEKSIAEVADELRTSIAYVSVLKSRALQRLRECEEFLEVLAELV